MSNRGSITLINNHGESKTTLVEYAENLLDMFAEYLDMGIDSRNSSASVAQKFCDEVMIQKNIVRVLSSKNPHPYYDSTLIRHGLRVDYLKNDETHPMGYIGKDEYGDTTVTKDYWDAYIRNLLELGIESGSMNILYSQNTPEVCTLVTINDIGEPYVKKNVNLEVLSATLLTGLQLFHNFK